MTHMTGLFGFCDKELMPPWSGWPQGSSDVAHKARKSGLRCFSIVR
jgi:hypothetical protein